MSVWRIMVVVNKSVRIFLVHLNAHATTDCKSIPQTMRNVLVSSKWFSIYFAIFSIFLLNAYFLLVLKIPPFYKIIYFQINYLNL